MKTLYALDLKMPGAHSGGWRRERPDTAAQSDEPDFTWYDLGSPLGYWFTTREAWPEVVTPLRLEIAGPGEHERQSGAGESKADKAPAKLRTARARLKPDGEAAGSMRLSSLLTVEIDGDRARVEVDSEAWPSVCKPVLFAVAQFWRYQAIDRALGELSDWARSELAGGRSLSWFWLRRSRELRARRRKLQTLILDLPDFESLSSNPRACLASGRSVRLYRALATQLGLEPWRCAIDERVEVVEAVYDSLAQSYDHFEAIAFQVALEVAILVVLFFDAGLAVMNVLAR
jgi:hypothetical protein